MQAVGNILRGEQLLRGEADEFLAGPAEQSLYAFVPRGRKAFEVDREDRVARDVRNERPITFFALAQRILRLLAFGTIRREADDRFHLTVGAALRKQVAFEMAPPARGVAGEFDLLGLSGVVHAAAGRFEWHADLGVDAGVAAGFAEKRFGRPAGNGFNGRVNVKRAQMPIHPEHDHRQSLDEARERAFMGSNGVHWGHAQSCKAFGVRASSVPWRGLKYAWWWFPPRRRRASHSAAVPFAIPRSSRTRYTSGASRRNVHTAWLARRSTM